ncbi:FecCD family ABC transporter permease [Williamsia herbipolensis]|uniref:FecCD family ABC transporter permease n=1 Tax=Williamsia herbipolensis TaxID=1603258 RepID=UPI0005F83D32|nr:iron chelate uptake ABC transporter family permease subunit [Williamsia herbipolensis]
MTETRNRPASTPASASVTTTATVRRRGVVRLGSLSFLVAPRTVIVGVVVTALALVLFAAGIGVGDYPLSAVDVGRILLGGGTRVENVIVFDVGLPRALVALLVGVGLGLSGALTQTIARNPLATPDVLGITAGASAAAVFGIAFGSGWGSWFADVGTPISALVGAGIGALLMYLLAWRGGIDAFRLVLVGVALTWVFQALVAFGLTRARINDVGRAQRWLIGSVSDATWASVTTLSVTLVAAVIAVTAVRRGSGVLGLGEDLARGLGVRTSGVTAVALVVAVVVAAITVSAAGPIAFVALLAPQIALRLCATPAPPPIISGIVGGVLVVGSDLLCRSLLPAGLSVGVVTAGIGGPFLIYLMIAVSRKASA